MSIYGLPSRRQVRQQDKVLRMIRKAGQHPDPTLAAHADMVIKLLKDPNLVWSSDLDEIRIELADLIHAVSRSGLFQIQLHLLIHALMPEIGLIDHLGLD